VSPEAVRRIADFIYTYDHVKNISSGRVESRAMAVRVDLAGKSVVCSVHDLLSDPLRRSIGTPGEGLSRLTVGAELHRVVQARLQAADPHFTPEV